MKSSPEISTGSTLYSLHSSICSQTHIYNTYINTFNIHIKISMILYAFYIYLIIDFYAIYKTVSVYLHVIVIYIFIGISLSTYD